MILATSARSSSAACLASSLVQVIALMRTRRRQAYESSRNRSIEHRSHLALRDPGTTVSQNDIYRGASTRPRVIQAAYVSRDKLAKQGVHRGRPFARFLLKSLPYRCGKPECTRRCWTTLSAFPRTPFTVLDLQRFLCGARCVLIRTDANAAEIRFWHIPQ